MYLPKSFKAKDVPSGPYFASATYVTVSRWRYILPFLKTSTAVESQAKSAPALVAYALRADVIGGRFWTYSLWTSRAAARQFVGTGAHAEAKTSFRKWAGADSAFSEWETPSPALNWPEAIEQLKTPKFHYGGEGTPASS